MQDLAIVISLILFFVIWWIVAKKLKPKKGLIVRNILGALVGFIVMIIFVALFVKNDDHDKNEVKSEPIAPAVATATEDQKKPEKDEILEQKKTEVSNETPEKNILSLNLTPEEYLHNLNLSLKEVDLPIKVPNDAELKSGTVNDTFTITMGNNLALSAVVAQSNGKLLSATLIGAGDGTEESGYIIMLAATASFMAAANAANESGKDKYSKVFLDLMKEMGQSDSSPSNIVDGIKFAIIPMGQMGTWFIAEAVE